MCNPVAAAMILTTAAATKYQSDQNKAAEDRAVKRQKEAEKKASAEKNAMSRNMESAENAPLLISKGGKPGAGGMSKLKIGGGAGGYSTLGMGGTGGTGLNIPTSG